METMSSSFSFGDRLVGCMSSQLLDDLVVLQRHIGRKPAATPVIYSLAIAGDAVDTEQPSKSHVTSGRIDDSGCFVRVHKGELNTMFNSNANAACNNNPFTFASLIPMSESYDRLCLAAHTLHPNEVDGRPSSLAKFFNLSQQRLKNWEERGVPNAEIVEISLKVGCRPTWLQLGLGDMVEYRKPNTDSPKTDNHSDS
ncbi:MAG TPA: hypothetical protein VF389_01345, partial [Woeseiaceae bacterium]